LRAVRWTSCNHLQLIDGRNQRLRGWLFPWGEPKVAALMEKIRASLGDDADKYFPRGKTAWHALRHLAGTMTAKKTKDPLAVKRVLGDASLHVAMMYVAEARGETYAACDDLAGDYVKSAQLMLTGRRSGDEPSAPSVVAVNAASTDGGFDTVRPIINPNQFGANK